MDRNNQQHEGDLIDLGAVSVETKGGLAPNEDTHGGIVGFGQGLSDD